jgi:hypothetical protein
MGAAGRDIVFRAEEIDTTGVYIDSGALYPFSKQEAVWFTYVCLEAGSGIRIVPVGSNWRDLATGNLLEEFTCGGCGEHVVIDEQHSYYTDDRWDEERCYDPERRRHKIQEHYPEVNVGQYRAKTDQGDAVDEGENS